MTRPYEFALMSFTLAAIVCGPRLSGQEDPFGGVHRAQPLLGVLVDAAHDKLGHLLGDGLVAAFDGHGPDVQDLAGGLVMLGALEGPVACKDLVGGHAEGEGMINCNGVEACYDAGLHGGIVTIKQGFTVEISGVSAGYFKAYTAGRLQLPGEYPPINFKGKGIGTAECEDEVCHLTMVFNTKTKGGGKLISRINIDHTSAGWAPQFPGTMIVATPIEGSQI